MSLLSAEGVSVSFKGRPLLDSVSIAFSPCSISTILGPSGSGKSTLIRCLNRLLDDEPGFLVQGIVQFRGNNVREVDVYELRKRIGIVFQKPIVFPISIEKNVLFGATLPARSTSAKKRGLVEQYLSEVGLWGEVKDRLSSSAKELSVGQQQRLAIARTLAVEPEVLLMDEPTSSLDAASATIVEDLIVELKRQRAIVLVTHDLQLATRISDKMAHLKPFAETGSRLEIHSQPPRNNAQHHERL